MDHNPDRICVWPGYFDMKQSPQSGSPCAEGASVLKPDLDGLFMAAAPWAFENQAGRQHLSPTPTARSRGSPVGVVEGCKGIHWGRVKGRTAPTHRRSMA